MQRLRLFIAAMALFAVWRLVLGGMQQEPSSAKPPNLVLVTVDTLRYDYVGYSGAGKVETPALDSLANDGVWFETAYCQVPLTPPSHASILTGTYPARHGVRDFTSGPLLPSVSSLAEILKERGYGTAAFISALVLDSVWGLDRGFDLYSDNFQAGDNQGVNPGNVQRPAEETIDQVLEWHSKAPQPFFLWVHLFDPHHDYNPPQPYKSRYSSDPYAGEVAYADSQIGRLVQALKQRQQYGRTLLVAVSDHGESLGEHREPNHGYFLYEATIRIPLLYKLPSGYRIPKPRIESVTQSVDILPTVLQILRIPQKREWLIEGRGQLSAILGKEGRPGFAYAESRYPWSTFGWSPLYSYREGRHKVIEAPSPELYDLEADPEESSNLYSSQRALGNQLLSTLRSLRQQQSAASGQEAAAVDPEVLERLAALGYATVSRAVAVEAKEGLADPKDMLPVYIQLVRALDAAESGQLQRSNSILEPLAQSHPELFIVHNTIGLNNLKMGRLQVALEAFEQAGKLNPDFESIDVNRARALAGLGRLEEAVSVLQQVVKRNPRYPAAQMQLGGTLRRAGKPQQAAEVYRQVLQQRPDDRNARKLLAVSLVDSQHYAEALPYLEKVLQESPPDALTLNYHGIALANQNRHGEALESYRRAIRIKPDYAQARLNLAYGLLRIRQPDEARKEFQEVCRLNQALCTRHRDRFSKP